MAPESEKGITTVQHNERVVPAPPMAHTPDEKNQWTAHNEIGIAEDPTAVNNTDIPEGELEKGEEHRPSAEDQLEALGSPNWRELQKKLVRRLDITLLPCLWVLYLFSEWTETGEADGRC